MSGTENLRWWCIEGDKDKRKLSNAVWLAALNRRKEAWMFHVKHERDNRIKYRQDEYCGFA